MYTVSWTLCVGYMHSGSKLYNGNIVQGINETYEHKSGIPALEAPEPSLIHFLRLFEGQWDIKESWALA